MNQTDAVSKAEMKAAEERHRVALETEHRAAAVRYDAQAQSLVIELLSGLTVTVPVRLLECLQGRTDSEIAGGVVESGGYAIHWDSFDDDCTVPGIMAGTFGRQPWMDKVRAKRAAVIAGRRKATKIRKALDAAQARSKMMTAAEMGRLGGAARSPAKTAAVRANGAKGGRPRKLIGSSKKLLAPA